jgi:hypothetical protein
MSWVVSDMRNSRHSMDNYLPIRGDSLLWKREIKEEEEDEAS